MFLSRRTLLQGIVGAAGTIGPPGRASTTKRSADDRIVPSSGEAIPAVGLGSWLTFNVGRDPVLRDEAADVMAAFFEAGGGMIDSSPMYGSSQAVIGYALEKLGQPKNLFSADKVWTSSDDGDAQIEQSRKDWGVPRFDLLQVHNLVNWERHLETLFQMKADGLLRYVGITTSHGRRHDLFEKVMKTKPLDFVQLTYNLLDREAEARLLPLAKERGMAVIVNRPFRGGSLIDLLEREEPPDWSQEIDAESWAQIALKFILSHEAVTLAIPATTRVDHVLENKAATGGRLPDADLRRKMIAHVQDL